MDGGETDAEEPDGVDGVDGGGINAEKPNRDRADGGKANIEEPYGSSEADINELDEPGIAAENPGLGDPWAEE